MKHLKTPYAFGSSESKKISPKAAVHQQLAKVGLESLGTKQVLQQLHMVEHGKSMLTPVSNPLLMPAHSPFSYDSYSRQQILKPSKVDNGVNALENMLDNQQRYPEAYK